MRNRPTHSLLCLVATVLLWTSFAPAGEADVKALLDGVSEITADVGVPGPLCVFGPEAFAVAMGRCGSQPAAVVAAGRLGKGRVVAFGHDGYIGGRAMGKADTARLMLNAVRWAAGRGGTPPRIGVHGSGSLVEFLRAGKLPAEAVDGSGWTQKLSSLDVVCLSVHGVTASERAALQAFVRAGGGLVGGGLGWGWLQLNRGKRIDTDHPGNLLLAPAGIAWADGYLSATGKAGYAVQGPPPPLCHAGAALDTLVAAQAGKTRLDARDLALAEASISRAASTLPADNAEIIARLTKLEADPALAAKLTLAKPLGSSDGLARAILALQVRRCQGLPPDQVRPHPSAGVFPGAVPADAPRVSRTVEIDTSRAGWHSTGLYAATGEVVTVTIPRAAAGARLQLRVGSHSDRLWHLDTWRRAPEICRSFPLDAARTTAANAFGGLLYVDVPGRCALGKLRVEIAGGVEAPLYVLGQTAADEWRRSIRSRPGPWAELAGERVVLTVPSKLVRTLDDPDELMKFWDSACDTCAELAGIEPQRPRPERYVADVQISAGWMHSGYPIMLHLASAETMVSKSRIFQGPEWGLFHELGHNHQSGLWTFDGTGEVTVNLFTLYVQDKLIGRRGHGFAPSPKRDQSWQRDIRAYLATGPDFAVWKSKPFLALIPYVQLQEAFGWEAFRKVFAEYRRLPPGQRPRSDDDKRNQWLVRFSRTVGRNLGPFFQAWGIPTSQPARDSIAQLPEWMPEGFPPPPGATTN